MTTTPKQPRTDQLVESVATPADGEGDAYFYKVGRDVVYYKSGVRMTQPVTSIELVYDLPGLHCNLGRYIIWSNGEMVAHIPEIAVECVTYQSPPKTE